MKASMGKAIDVDLSDEALKHERNLLRGEAKNRREMEYKAEAKRLAEMKASMGKAIDVDLSDEALKHRGTQTRRRRREIEERWSKSKAKELKEMAAWIRRLT